MIDPAKVEQQLKEVRDTAIDARTLTVAFVAVLLYVNIIVGSSTHEQILRVSGVTLPLLNVELPIVGFFLLTPWLVFFLHLNLLVQHFLLSQQLFSFSATIQADETLGRPYLRSLGHLPFVHWLIGTHHNLGMRFLFAVVMQVAFVLWPVATLLSLQILFLPYHDETWTFVQQLAILADCLMLAWLWPKILHPSDRTWDWWWRTPRRCAQWAWRNFVPLAVRTRGRRWREVLQRAVHRLGNRIRELATDLDRRWRGMAGQPEPPVADARPAVVATTPPRGVVGSPSLLLLVVGFALGWSSLVATIPGSHAEKVALSLAEGTLCENTNRTMLVTTCWLHESPNTRMPRNLVITEKVLVANKIDPSIEHALLNEAEPRMDTLAKVVGLDLKNRDLRYANLSGSSLPKADLRGANLAEAKLVNARLVNADLRPHPESEAESWCFSKGGGAFLHGAPPSGGRTVAVGANFQGASLVEARLNCANLAGIDLSRASLHGADLDKTLLVAATLSGARMDGARMRYAQLGGSTLTRATLLGVDSSNAGYEVVSAKGVRLEGARMTGAILAGADMDDANLRLTDLSVARAGGYSPEEAASAVTAALAQVDGDRYPALKRRIAEELGERMQQHAIGAARLPDLDRQPCIGAPSGVIRSAKPDPAPLKKARSRDGKGKARENQVGCQYHNAGQAAKEIGELSCANHWYARSVLYWGFSTALEPQRLGEWEEYLFDPYPGIMVNVHGHAKAKKCDPYGHERQRFVRIYGPRLDLNE